jgi:hypothetical protein
MIVLASVAAYCFARAAILFAIDNGFIRVNRVGGLRFVRINRLQVSYCICREA